MSEYIDRKSLIDEFDRLGLGEHSFVERVFSDGVRTIIAGIPAADVAPVVRCKDCLFWKSGKNECESWEWCKTLHHDMPSHAFCNFGVRKDDLPDDA